ncbi:General transcription and DNA repair factor IIH subunit ssl1 [Penicillium daleae]|uniref:General transcription and DNA repair factor IIH n=1 Tax=Penicillium daleae TaxID=63821 RepID=A0AAD6CFI3_9EURO|nr:General transcription and DNA repair factor IIH subunit ssl1 [Penicillium daleae]KAJ5461072.1 General transcription and DNA repair factor IIH subunit ssl1 [Penicillium daleae]
MADSDEEYVGSVTDDEDDFQVTRTDQVQPRKRKQRGGAEWELSRTWESLVEGADGTISSTVEGLLEASKRKRLLKDTTPLQRGIIRHLILILDLSQSMSEKDLRPTRYLLTLRYAQEFVREFFEQNPISQLGVLGLRDGLALRVSDISGNPTEHLTAIQELKTQDPKGLPSLQNGLEMARGALFHTPSHGTREVLVIFGSLLSSDPGDIHQTINTLVADKVRVRIVGLAAKVAICQELCSRTNRGDETAYGVALNEQHFRELLMDVTTPLATQKQSASSLLMMGFPSRTVEPNPSLCACHSKPSRGGVFVFPLWEQSVQPAGRVSVVRPHADSVDSPCALLPPLIPFDKLGGVPPEDQWSASENHAKGMSVSSRYQCTACQNHFCIDCDLFAHEVVHNCPGCQSKSIQAVSEGMDTTV